MRLGSQIIALVVAWQMAPGMTELAENLVHLVTTGHSAHAIDDEQHAPEGDEHGCTSTFHVCQCHSSAPFVMSMSKPRVRTPALHRDSVPELQDLRADGYLTSVFRPPRA